MPSTSSEVLCKCCVKGITRYYRVTINGNTNRKSPDCPTDAAYVFDLSDQGMCTDVLINSWCYTPFAFNIGKATDECLNTFEVVFTGLSSDIPSVVRFRGDDLEDCLENHILPFTFQVGNFECSFPDSCQVEPIPPESMGELTESDCFRPNMDTRLTTINRPGFAMFNPPVQDPCKTSCEAPQPAIPGVGGIGGGNECSGRACDSSMDIASGNASVAQSMPVADPDSPAINTQRSPATPPGYRASSAFTRSVTPVDASTADVSQLNGSVNRHRCKDERGAYLLPPDCTSKLVQNGNGTRTETTSTGIVYDYDASGVLKTIQDASGQQWSLISVSPLSLSFSYIPARCRTPFTYVASSKIRRI